ncbi:MAG: methionine synthase [Actinobacteria bacterium]|nr:methionine synthase [Actinomycetota bacterium]
MSFEAKCMATAIGSVPHMDAGAACSLILDNLYHIPMWPQLPNISFKENMYVQYSEGMPGITIDEVERRVYFDTAKDIIGELETLFRSYLAEEIDAFAIGQDYARGLYTFLELLSREQYPEIKILKGHITGPISMGLAVSDQSKKPGLYDDVLREGFIKTLAMKAKYQVKRFKEVRPNLPTLIFIDEPYLMSYGSALISLNRDQAVGYLEEVIGAIDGLTGIHCCGNTDWSLLAETSVDIISFDAYSYSETIALYPKEMKAFLDRGGILAWGIVPSGLPLPDQVARESVASLVERLEAGMQLLVDKGIDKELLLNQALITPNCGTGSMKPEFAERTFTLSHEASEVMRRKYFS